MQSELTLGTGTPSGVSQAGAAYTGAPGSVPIYYWIVARFAGGSVRPYSLIATNTAGIQNLSVSNYVTITWQAEPHAVSYDVLRSGTSVFPASGSSCAIILGTTSLSVVDVGGAVFVYPPPGLSAITQSSFTLTVDNQTGSEPQLRAQINNQSTVLSIPTVNTGTVNVGDTLALGPNSTLVAGGAGGDAVTGASNLTTSGCVTFTDSVSGEITIDATANEGLFWDPTNHRMGVGNASPDNKVSIQADNATPYTLSATRNTIGDLTINSGAVLCQSNYQSDAVGGFVTEIRADVTTSGNTNQIDQLAAVYGSVTSTGAGALDTYGLRFAAGCSGASNALSINGVVAGATWGSTGSCGVVNGAVVTATGGVIAGTISQLTGVDITLNATGTVTHTYGVWVKSVAGTGTQYTLRADGMAKATSASAGAATALPATPAGYLIIVVDGVEVKIPYYAA